MHGVVNLKNEARPSLGQMVRDRLKTFTAQRWEGATIWTEEPLWSGWDRLAKVMNESPGDHIEYGCQEDL